MNIEELFEFVTCKDDKTSLEAVKQLCEISKTSDEIYKNYFTQLCDYTRHKKSFVRNRSITLLCENSKYLSEAEAQRVYDCFVPMLHDEKAVTVRYLLSNIPLLVKNHTSLLTKNIALLSNADFSHYSDSMSPLLEKDAKKALEILREM